MILTAFLDFHRRQLTSFNLHISTLLAQFCSHDFHQRAIAVQEQLVKYELIDQIEPRLLKATEPGQMAFAAALMAEIQKNTGMWYKLFNDLIKDAYEAQHPLPKAQVDTLVDESMYTYACLIEKILAYRTMDQDSRWNGYVRNELYFRLFGRHYLMVFYAQAPHGSLSAVQVRGAHQDLLAELNAQMQAPVMEDLFLIGVELNPARTALTLRHIWMRFIKVVRSSMQTLSAYTSNWHS